MIFHSCRSLHCFEWDGSRVYIPPCGLIGEYNHRILLRAFKGQKTENGFSLFDESVYNDIFTNTNKYRKLRQKEKNYSCG